MVTMFRTLSPSSTPSEANSGMSPLPWILDSGASFHMTGDRSILRDIVTINPVSVVLPDGDVTAAVSVGSTKFGDILLSHVLFIPALTCNLLSLATLTRQLSCLVILSPKFCVLQEFSSRTVIGVGEEHGGVYWLRSLGSSARASSALQPTTSTTSWHRRLGHPSATVISSIPSLALSKTCLDSIEPCTACHKGKKTRCSFSLSSHKAEKLFELLHLDVWGP